MPDRTLAFDRQNLTLVAFSGSLVAMPPITQNDVISFSIQGLNRTGDPYVPFTIHDYAGASGLAFTLSERSTGTLADSDDFLLAEALEPYWAWNATTKLWTGFVNFGTPAIAAWLGALDKKTAILQIDVITGNDRAALYFHEQLVRSSASSGSLSAAGGQVVQLPLVDGMNGVTIVANKVTVTGLAWVSAPKAVRVTVTPPNETEAGFFCWTPADGISTTGFYFLMSGLPDSDDYLFEYEAVF